MISTLHRLKVLESGVLTPEARALVPSLPCYVKQFLLSGDDGSAACFWLVKGAILIEDTSAHWAEEAIKLFVADGSVKELP